MKLWKVTVKTYYFGTSHYILLVVAESKEEAIQEVYKYPKYNKDEDAEIDSVEEIDISKPGII